MSSLIPSKSKYVQKIPLGKGQSSAKRLSENYVSFMLDVLVARGAFA